MANAATALRRATRLLLALALLAMPCAMAWAADTPASIAALVDAGQFQTADADITQALNQPGLDVATREALLFQRERMRRIRYDFSLDADALKARIRQQVPDLRDDEFRDWDEHGLLERMVIDGRVMYFKRDASNLFRLSAEAAARRAHPAPFDDDPMGVLNDYHREVRAAALQENRSSVLPHRVRITQTLTVDADAVPAGKTVRAWIPYPKPLPGQQDDIRYVSSMPAKHEIAPDTAPKIGRAHV